MKKEVYVVTAGEYSDYHIKEVFSSYEKAEEFVAYIGEYCEIETYELDVGEFYRKRVRVTITKDEVFCPSYIRCEDIRRGVWQHGRKYENPKIQYVELFVETESREKAVKIGNEKRLQLNARNAWDDMEILRVVMGPGEIK